MKNIICSPSFFLAFLLFKRIFYTTLLTFFLFACTKDFATDEIKTVSDNQIQSRLGAGCNLDVTIGLNVVDICYVGEMHNTVLAWGKTQYLNYESDSINEPTINALVNITEAGLDSLDSTWYIDGYGVGESTYAEAQNYMVFNNLDSVISEIHNVSMGYRARGFITQEEFDFVDSITTLIRTESFDSEDIDEYVSYWGDLEKNDYDGLLSAIFLSVAFHSYEFWTEEEEEDVHAILVADVVGAYASVFYEIGSNWGCNCWEGSSGQQRIIRAAQSGAITSSAARGFGKLFGFSW